jgi:hypothetical protein
LLRQCGAERRRTLRQLFSAFPGGRSGAALVLLRVALGTTGIAEGFSCLVQGANIESQGFGMILATSGAFVLAGLFTSYMATVVAIAIACRDLSPLSIAPSTLIQGTHTSGILFVLGLAVALLGPGQFSLDFRLFGRREIMIPRRREE